MNKSFAGYKMMRNHALQVLKFWPARVDVDPIEAHMRGLDSETPRKGIRHEGLATKVGKVH